ncbi:hypothetical protein K8R61_02025 [bacterium]|nr:hypothetical protein [bacterium]
MEDVFKKYKIDLDDWMNYGQWEQPPMSASFFVNWHDEEICQKLGVKIKSSSIIMLNGYTIIEKKVRGKIHKVTKKALDNNDKDFFKKYRKETQKIFNKQENLCSELEENQFTNLDGFERFTKVSLKLYTTWYFSVVMGEYMGEYIFKKANKYGFPEKEILNNMRIQPTLMINEHNESAKIKDQLKKEGLINLPTNKLIKILSSYPMLYLKIKEHIEKYEWVGTHHMWGEPLNLRKYLKDLKDVSFVAHSNNLNKLPSDLKFAIEAGQESAYIRQYSAEIFNVSAYKARSLFNRIAKSFNLSYEDFIFLTPGEVVHLLRENKRPDCKTLTKRKRGCCVLLVDNKEVVIDDKIELNGLIDKFVPRNNSKKLSGTIANNGHAKGRAKIFLVPKDLQKMNTGDVLVTPMTTPDFIPLIKKASAIITDVGGLLSHAAIISRELEKPCIIGTKVATRVLKDGDLVEVDANKGIIKIIK